MRSHSILAEVCRYIFLVGLLKVLDLQCIAVIIGTYNLATHFFDHVIINSESDLKLTLDEELDERRVS